jgi:hypothetical protein
MTTEVKGTGCCPLINIMEKNTVKKLSHSTFILAILSALLTILQVSTIFTWVTIGVAIIYLFGGWYLFKGYYPEGNPILLFLWATYMVVYY